MTWEVEEVKLGDYLSHDDFEAVTYRVYNAGLFCHGCGQGIEADPENWMPCPPCGKVLTSALMVEAERRLKEKLKREGLLADPDAV